MKKILFWIILVALAGTGYCQEVSNVVEATVEETAATKADTAESAAAEEADLEEKQRLIHDQWKRLEEVLLRMAEATAATDPDRAELLKKVVTQSKQKMIDPQFQTLTELLQDGELGRALDNQKELRADLNDLLKVLETENRMRRVKSEKERLKGYIRELDKIIAGQKNLQNRTMNGSDFQSLAQEQDKIQQNANQLEEQIKQDESSDNPDGKQSDGKQSDGKQSDGKQSDGKQSDGKQSDGKQSDGKQSDGKQSDGKQSDGKQSDGKQSDGKQSDGKQSDEQQSDEQPKEPSTQERLKNAQDKMKEAQEKLEKAQKEGAVEKQEEALRELEKAKKELEEILRQLREEEEKRTLAQLEVRFKKMLDLQKAIYDTTIRLDKQVQDNGGKAPSELSIESVRLSSRENDVLLEANKALLLLREDGTAAAMTEALTTAAEDMDAVIKLLNQANVGMVNQARQENIMATMEELIEAVKRAMKDKDDKDKDKSKPKKQDEQMSDMESALVDALAELRMIRSMQLRINKTTQRCKKLITGPAAENPDVIQALDELSNRQRRLQQILRDMSLGKNQ